MYQLPAVIDFLRETGQRADLVIDVIDADEAFEHAEDLVLLGAEDQKIGVRETVDDRSETQIDVAVGAAESPLLAHELIMKMFIQRDIYFDFVELKGLVVIEEHVLAGLVVVAETIA